MTIKEMYPAIPESKCFVDMLDSPFSRRGSFMAFANENHGESLYGKCKLWLSTCRVAGGMSADLYAPNGFRQIKLEAVKDGMVLPCVLSTTPYEVILETLSGSIRFCIGERRLAMAYGTDGLSLRVTPTPKFWSPGSTALGDGHGSRLLDFKFSRLLAIPFTGKLSHSPESIEIAPDDKGVIRLGFEEFTEDPVPRPFEDYPTYDKCVELVKADFDGFCQKVMPDLPEPFERARLQALWQTWSMIVDPDGHASYKHTMVKMIHSIFEAAFVWQQPMQAVWLSRDKELAWEVYKSGFDHQDKNGRLTDALGPVAMPSDGLKPPVHGLALLWLMEHGIIDGVSDEEKREVWEKLERWTLYWTEFRDADKDGLMEFCGRFETGWEDAPYYSIGFPCADPGLNALLVLQMEALAALGESVNMPSDITEKWMSRAKTLAGEIPGSFWDGKNWFAFNPETGERSKSTTVSLYTVLLLGHRLPEDIINKTIELITGPNGLETPYGIASESPVSPYFEHGFTAGSVISPAQFLMALAFEFCNRRDLAEKLARGHCEALANSGFFHILNSLTGNEDRSLTAFGERGLFWSAWSSSCYLWLADTYCRPLL